jgi:hypothetical protein
MTVPSPTSPSLLLRLRDPADAGSWQTFIDVYLPLVYGHCRKRGLQDADATDVALSGSPSDVELLYQSAVVCAGPAAAQKDDAARRRLVARCVVLLRRGGADYLAPGGVKALPARATAFAPIRTTVEFAALLGDAGSARR